MRSIPVLIGLALIGGAPAFAQFTPISQPTAAYTGGTVEMPIPQANLNPIGTTLSSGGQTLTFSSALQARLIGSGWGTWASAPDTEGNSTKVGVLIPGVTTFTITLTPPSTTFGFEWEPNAGTSTMTATFLNGSTTLGTITLPVAGSSGAKLFAATSATPITSVSLSIPDGGGGAFAFARFRTVPSVVTGVPAAGTTSLFGLGALLLAGGAMLARKQSAAIQ